MKQKIKIDGISKVITESILGDYLALCAEARKIEKQKEELRASILEAYPVGGSVGRYIIFIEEMTRRTFPLDDVKAKVAQTIWSAFYEPYINISTYPKLTVKSLSGIDKN